MDVDRSESQTVPCSCPTGQVQLQPDSEFHVHQQLRLHELGALIELGIKFFLYQRGQITVPFDSLHTSEDNVEGPDSEGTIMSLPEGLMDPKQRLKLLVDQQAKIRQEKRILKRKKIEIVDEVKAWCSLQGTIQTLRDLFNTSSQLGVGVSNIAIVLAFGQNLFNPKELIIFYSASSSRRNETDDAQVETLDMNKTSKQFYKSIIMSIHFGDFVCKRLRRTASHLSLVISQALSEEVILKYSLSPLGNYLPLLQPKLGDIEYETTAKHRRRSHQPRMFLINLKHVDDAEPNLSWDTLQTYFTYKIPMSFNGMRRIVK